MGAGLLAVNDRLPDGSPIIDHAAEESIVHIEKGITIALAEFTHQDIGTLYLTTKRLVWLSDQDEKKGYAVDFLSLCMHAICRDPEAYPQPCIYAQIDSDEIEDLDEGYDDEAEEERDEMEGHEPEAAMGEEEPSDLSLIQEMWLIPENESSLEQLFKALCDCAAQNPDPAGGLEGEGEWFYNEEEVDRALGASVDSHQNGGPVEVNADQFEDADEWDEYDEEDLRVVNR